MTILHERRFRAMNTDVAAWLWAEERPAASARLDQVMQFFEGVEAELSRFRDTSGLSRLNVGAGAGPQRVSTMLGTVLGLALQAARDSHGVFDPTVLYGLRRAGYDRSFEQIGLEELATPRTADRIGWQQVQLDTVTGAVTLPAGVGIDLGGIAKGWAVDRAVELLGRGGPALVDAGGDMRASAAPGGEPWPIAIQDPFDVSRDRGIIRLAAGAVATSSVGRRRWQQGKRTMHHLLDPRTGEPSRSDLHTVTVVAPTTVVAEVAAKVALILGAAAGRAYLEAHDLRGVLIGHDGAAHVIGSLAVEPV